MQNFDADAIAQLAFLLTGTAAGDDWRAEAQPISYYDPYLRPRGPAEVPKMEYDPDYNWEVTAEDREIAGVAAEHSARNPFSISAMFILRRTDVPQTPYNKKFAAHRILSLQEFAFSRIRRERLPPAFDVILSRCAKDPKSNFYNLSATYALKLVQDYLARRSQKWRPTKAAFMEASRAIFYVYLDPDCGQPLS